MTYIDLSNEYNYVIKKERFIIDLVQLIIIVGYFGTYSYYKDGKTLYVCMMNFGEYDPLELPEYDGKSVDGIRVAQAIMERYAPILKN